MKKLFIGLCATLLLSATLLLPLENATTISSDSSNSNLSPTAVFHIAIEDY